MDPSNLLSLPTDSLYKFMAMSGLVILFISVFFPFYLKKQFVFKLYDLRRDHNLTKTKIANLREEFRILKASYMQTKADGGLGAEDLFQKSDKAIDEQKSIDILIENNECEVKKMEYLAGSVKMMNWFSAIGILTGLTLTISGFSLWYIRLQIFVDGAVASGTVS